MKKGKDKDAEDHSTLEACDHLLWPDSPVTLSLYLLTNVVVIKSLIESRDLRTGPKQVLASFLSHVFYLLLELCG